MKIVILTEGGERIGFGHVTRCSAIYEAFAERGIIPEFVINGDKTFSRELFEKNFEVFDWLEEKERLLALLGKAEIVVVDSYLADSNFYKTIARSVGILVCLDDYKRLDYPDGVVINSALGIDPPVFPARPGLTYLLGLSYVPLRKEFWDVKLGEVRKIPKTVMVICGGSNIGGLAEKILKLLVEEFPELNKDVILGPGFKDSEIIKKVSDEKIRFIERPNAFMIKETMQAADMAVSAGGQTLYELARCGVPTIAVCVAENQRNHIAMLEKERIVINAGWYEDKALPQNIRAGIHSLIADRGLREKMSFFGRAAVDGQGARRIADSLLKRAES